MSGAGETEERAAGVPNVNLSFSKRAGTARHTSLALKPDEKEYQAEHMPSLEVQQASAERFPSEDRFL